MKVVITGVNGFIGAELARRYLRDGHSVTGVARGHARVDGLTDFYAATLGQDAPVAAWQGADLLIHAAHDREIGALERNVEGTKRWAEAARRAGVGRQVFLTSVSAHADSPSEYGRAKAALEPYFADMGALLLRPGLVVGPGGTFGDMARMIRRLPCLPVFGGDDLQVVLTEMDALYAVLARAESFDAGAVLNLFQKEWVGLRTLSLGIKAHFGCRTLIMPVPLGPALFFLGLGQSLGLPRSLSPQSLRNLQECRSYGYESSYESLGLPTKTLDQMMRNAFK